MTSSAGTLITSSGLLQAERQVILDAAHRMIAVANTDPAGMSREELADAVGGLVATSEHAAVMAGRYMDVGDTNTVCLTKGEKSIVAMVSSRNHLSRRRARQLLRAGKLEHRFTHFHNAAMTGRITTGHVDAFVGLADRANSAQVAAAERDLAALAVLCTPEEFIDQLRIWEAAADPTEHLDEYIRAQARRNLSWAADLFGNVHLSGTLEPVAGEQVVNAILDRKAHLENESDVKGVAANHDALVDLVLGESAGRAHIEVITTDNYNNRGSADQASRLNQEPVPSGTDHVTDADPADLHHLDSLTNLTLEVEAAEHLARFVAYGPSPAFVPLVPTYWDKGFNKIIYPRTAAGIPIPPAVVEELSKTGRVRRHLMNSDGTLQADQAAGRRFTSVQKRMIRLRDNHCQHPGCRTPARWCDTDHITPWETGGPTLIDNGQLLCRFHHRWKRRNDPKPKSLQPNQFDDSRLSSQLE